jgi:hypothetical protein
MHTAYPEIYLFHDGGPQGDHNSFDFWPPRKEVFIDGGDPVAMLSEINARAITRLAVPDNEPGDPERLTLGISTWAEQAAARERAGGMRIETYRRIDIERALGVIAGLGAG